YLERFSPPVDGLRAFMESWEVSNAMTAIGGTIMFVSAVLFFLVVLRTIFNRHQVTEPQVMPIIDEPIHSSKESWLILDRIGLWAGAAACLSVIIYGEVIFHYLPLELIPGGYQLW
ncbi:hypothetical protein B7486_66860, partial [cyanobacterium TDX16]